MHAAIIHKNNAERTCFLRGRENRISPVIFGFASAYAALVYAFNKCDGILALGLKTCSHLNSPSCPISIYHCKTLYFPMKTLISSPCYSISDNPIRQNITTIRIVQSQAFKRPTKLCSLEINSHID